MATTYEKADRETARYVVEVAEEFHPRLEKAGVTLGVLFASPELKHRGMPAAATVKITGSKDRAAGLPDAIIILHREGWDELEEVERRALADHEAAHLLVVTDGDGMVKRDENGRPRLKMRKHDAEIGFFFDVVERHQEHAAESRQFVQLNRKMAQLAFPWG
jgi:hypothetical protein